MLVLLLAILVNLHFSRMGLILERVATEPRMVTETMASRTSVVATISTQEVDLVCDHSKLVASPTVHLQDVPHPEPALPMPLTKMLKALALLLDLLPLQTKLATMKMRRSTQTKSLLLSLKMVLSLANPLLLDSLWI